MADLRSVFVNLEDSSSKAGLPLHKALEGDAILNKNAHGALVAKDASSNFAYLHVNAAGQLIVIAGEDFTPKSDYGTHAGDNSTFQKIATITLTADKIYRSLEIVASSFRDTVFKITQNDNSVETDLFSFRVGNSELSEEIKLDTFKLTAGSTGTQELILYGKNLNAASTMDGYLGTKEMA